MRVIFCDNHLLVVDKPAGMSTQPHDDGGVNATDLAKAWIKAKYQKPGAVFLEPIHRLDKPVRGLLLFARTSKALSRLQSQMRERQIKKTYLAQVDNPLPQQKGSLEHYLIHDSHRARVVAPSHKEAKQAILHYEQKGSHLLIDLETGRYHQIRAQFAANGCPIKGDKKYGSRSNDAELALEHVRLQFSHPVTKQALDFKIRDFF